MSVLPPPYTPVATAESSSGTAQQPDPPLTPLPSYTASPVLSPSLPAGPFGKASASFVRTHTHTGTARPARETLDPWLATVAVAILGATLADALYLAAVNLLGVLLTLLQLPVALLVWRPHASLQSDEETERRPIGRRGAKQVDGLRWFTQKMWDWHDRLEEAELETPSSRTRHAG